MSQSNHCRQTAAAVRLAGLVYGIKQQNIKTNILGISVDCTLQQQFENLMCKIALDINSLTNKNLSFSPQDFNVSYDYLGKGYAILSQAEKSATVQLTQTKAIFLDSVYTAKAFAGFIDLIKQKKLSGNLLFWLREEHQHYFLTNKK